MTEPVKPQAQPRPLHFELYFGPKYLRVGHLFGRDRTFTIKEVKHTEVKNPKKPSEPPQLKMEIVFVEKAPPWLVNKTNAKSIAKVMKTPDTTQWIGKRVTLYQGRVQNPAGGMTDGICVRETVSAKTGPEPEMEPPRKIEIDPDAPEPTLVQQLAEGPNDA